MRPDVLIVGQGLAGSLLGWELERAGISFAICDGGHTGAATMVAAGLITPITGRRLVKSWEVDQLRPLARATYSEIEDAVRVPLWHELKVRRWFADERERRVFAAKRESGELSPYAGEGDADGFWIRQAARVDLTALLGALRERWSSQGRLREEVTNVPEELSRHALVVECSGYAGATRGGFAFVPWEFSKGEVIEVAVDGLEPGVVLSRRHWVVPVRPGVAWIGATHKPGVNDCTRTEAARATLTASVRDLLPGDFTVTGQRAGVRVNLPDKLPVAGRHPEMTRLGVFNGLGAKGALFAPRLAREWAEHIRSGTRFHPQLDVARFAK